MLHRYRLGSGGRDSSSRATKLITVERAGVTVAREAEPEELAATPLTATTDEGIPDALMLGESTTAAAQFTPATVVSTTATELATVERVTSSVAVVGRAVARADRAAAVADSRSMRTSAFHSSAIVVSGAAINLTRCALPAT